MVHWWCFGPLGFPKGLLLKGYLDSNPKALPAIGVLQQQDPWIREKSPLRRTGSKKGCLWADFSCTGDRF